MPATFIDGVGIAKIYSRDSHWLGFPFMPESLPLPEIPNPDYHVPYISAWDGKSVESPKIISIPFICQIDCRDMPEEVVELPHEGMFYIFVDLRYYIKMMGRLDTLIPSPENLRVIYVPEEELTDLTVRRDESLRYRYYLPLSLITLKMEKPKDGEYVHQLLGEIPEWIPEAYGFEKDKFRLFFCMESGYGCNFLGNGLFAIFIPPEDLERHDYSNVSGFMFRKGDDF